MRMRILMMTTMAASAALMGASGAHAQSALESRVDRIEREMRANRQQNPPARNGQRFEPQIEPETDTTVPGTPASNPLADTTQRVAELEAEVRTLTGDFELSQNRLRQLEQAFSAYKRSTEARLKALEETASSIGGAPDHASPADTLPVAEPMPAPKPTPKPAESGSTPAKPAGTRAQQVAAIERPATGDGPEDGYLYGYRLWQAKFYPEARKELEQVVAKYPKHRRASYAQNLLGRAYLDAGAPSLAAVAFYDNFKRNPDGERASHSLYYLAQALRKLNKPAAEICKVYGELTQLYSDDLTEEMRAGVAEGRARAKCKP